ncbi:MAG: hypothetical protein KAX19_13230, partial [Candidatus Brocadiae bacterium]|nr:hypothetical protein [Candidatus Brocadiia bacterium]
RVPADRYGFNVSWDVNRALYHLGLLPYEMFSHPQELLSLLPANAAFDHPKAHDTVSLKFSDVFMDLGYVNGAEHRTYQALELIGERPWILERLALISLAKGETEAGRVLLQSLSRDLVYRKRARASLSRLEADPSLAGDKEVCHLRSIMMHEDCIGWPSYEEMFIQLLQDNRRNRMAFEYLMAYYLLVGRIDKVAANIVRLDDFGYSDIPRHYEEAILIYEAATRSRADLHGRSVSPRTLQRFRAFTEVWARYRGDRRAAWRALARDHRDSYFFYYQFHQSMGGRA